MGQVYVLGAGFSKTCNIATDYEMLDALNRLLPKTKDKSGVVGTCVDALREQNFRDQQSVSFEAFLSTLSALKFIPEFMEVKPNTFAKDELEILRALKQYLKIGLERVRWNENGAVILDFVRRLNWQRDAIITFNYDLLVEAALERSGIDTAAKVIHLHGAITDRTMVYPTYKKLAFRNTRTQVAKGWKKAFDLLRTTRRIDPLDRLTFIGYSMPPSDLEAKGLFNYTDWYNCHDNTSRNALSLVPIEQHYGYEIDVVNPCPEIRPNYEFFRKTPVFHCQSLADWLAAT